MIKEIEILNQVNEYLKENGFSVKNEVKFLERRIDVVGIKKKKVIAVEVKVKDWKKAFQQAITCKLCSHYVYVALLYKHIPKDITLFEEYGIGLMSVNGFVEIVNKPKKSRLIHNRLLKMIMKEVGREK